MGLSNHLARRADLLQMAAIRGVVMRMGPDFISFVAGKPAPSLFPLDEVYQKTGTILEKYGPAVMQYASTLGFQPLREWVAARVPPAEADNVLMVAGSQQAIDLTGKLFLDPGDKVVLSAPTYTSALTTLRVYDVEFVTVASDRDGMLPGSLEAAFRQSPKLLYCNPNFANPNAVTMSRQRRQELVTLAQRYDVPILEDDPYGELRFAGERLPNLYELAPEQVIYAGTFSKIVAPGFRVGWLVTPAEIFQKMMMAKQTSDLQVSSYAQMLLYEVVQDGFIEAQIARVREYYRRQRDLMLAALDRHMPTAVAYDKPEGGMFIWLVLPEAFDAAVILDACFAEKVAYVPGAAFYPDGAGKNTIRLSYSLATPAEIERGIKTLGRVFRAAGVRDA